MSEWFSKPRQRPLLLSVENKLLKPQADEKNRRNDIINPNAEEYLLSSVFDQ